MEFPCFAGPRPVSYPVDHRPHYDSTSSRTRQNRPATCSVTFAALLETRFGLPVHLADERLTSYAVDKEMGPMELTRGRKKERRDALAAAMILRDFLARRRED
jgi:putative transcription antitermination factor YqgF